MAYGVMAVWWVFNVHSLSPSIYDDCVLHLYATLRRLSSWHGGVASCQGVVVRNGTERDGVGYLIPTEQCAYGGASDAVHAPCE